MVVEKISNEGDKIGKGCEIVLWVESIEECLTELKRKGVKILRKPYKVPAGLFALIEDSEGNTIKIYEGAHG